MSFSHMPLFKVQERSFFMKHIRIIIVIYNCSKCRESMVIGLPDILGAFPMPPLCINFRENHRTWGRKNVHDRKPRYVLEDISLCPR